MLQAPRMSIPWLLLYVYDSDCTPILILSLSLGGQPAEGHGLPSAVCCLLLSLLLPPPPPLLPKRTAPPVNWHCETPASPCLDPSSEPPVRREPGPQRPERFS